MEEREHEGRMLVELSEELRELIGTRVERVSPEDYPMGDAAGFLRKYVVPSRPAVFRGAVERERWRTSPWANAEYLEERVGDCEVTVAFTPDGYADALVHDKGSGREVFAQPFERTMKFAEFLAALKGREDGGGVPYLSAQNSSLSSELPALLEDCGVDVPFATEAFGSPPEAVNIWIGDERSVTTMHRDHYENLYFVVTGIKTFMLLPPTDSFRLGMRSAPAARYDRGLKLDVEDPLRLVRWCPIYPNSPPSAYGPGPPPMQVTVRAGEALYLPAMWLHAVSQASDEDGHPCIAINYWYGMDMCHTYPYVSFCEKLTRVV